MMGALALGVLVPASVCRAEGETLRFEALRNGRRIGQQRTSIERPGAGEAVVRTEADFAVKLGPLTLYRYRHEATERWAGERLVSLETRTNQNGRVLQVSARREADQLLISNAAGKLVRAPASAAPLSHWSAEHLRRPLFNPQDGKLLRVRVSGPRPATIRLADGSGVTGTTIALSGDAQIEDSYDDRGLWAALVGKLPDGSTLEYRRA